MPAPLRAEHGQCRILPGVLPAPAAPLSARTNCFRYSIALELVVEREGGAVPDSGLLRIQCAFCLRTYARVGFHDYLRPSTLRARPPLKITPSAPWREPPELSPEVLAAFPPGTRIRETLPGQGGRLVFTCFPTKCLSVRLDRLTTTTTTISFDRWTQAVEEALNVGRRELLIGGPGGPGRL
jgi:hypothetical protein